MRRFVGTIAMLACFLVLVTGLWQDWGFLSTLKRMVMAYLAFFILGSLMALSVRFVGMFEEKQDVPVKGKAKLPRTEAPDQT